MNVAQFVKGELIVGFNEPQINGKCVIVTLKNPKLSEIEQELIEDVNEKMTKMKVLSSLRRKLQSELDDTTVVSQESLNQINEYTKQITDLRKEIESISGPTPNKGDYKKVKIRIVRTLNLSEHQIVKELLTTNKVLHLAEVVGKLPKRFRKTEETFFHPELSIKQSELED